MTRVKMTRARIAGTSARGLIVIAVCLVAFAAAAISAHAQSPRHELVRRAALDYLEGFYEGDTVKLMRSVRPDVAKYGFDLPRGATAYIGEPMKWEEFLSYARQFKARGRVTPASAPREVLLLDVLDQTAAVKVTAWWGTDYLLLGKYDGRWMISHVLWQSTPPKSP